MSSMIVALAALLLGGAAVAATAGDSGDKGWGIDPNGGRVAAVSCDAGGTMDPNGCPVRIAAATADEGSQMDPNGRPHG